MSRRLLHCLPSSVSSLFMARQRRKRPLEDDPSPPEPLQDSRAFKRIKTGHSPRQQHHEVQTYAPSPPRPSQDSHSVKGTTVDLFPVKEVELSHIAAASQPSPDQKTPRATPPSPPSPPSRSEDDHPANDHKATGPALPGPVIPLTRQALKKFEKMSSRRSKRSSGFSSRGSRDTDATTVSSTKSDKVTAYSNSFPQILQDKGIHQNGDLFMLADREELLRERSLRPSLAPSQCSDGEIEEIIQSNANAATEPDIERDVVPAIVGRHHSLPHSGNVSWTNMSSMTESLTVAPQPDLYYGTRVGDIPKSIRDSVGDLIIPSTVPNAPASPHFVLENKGPAGSLEVVRRQAAHSAAAAARAAHALDNLGVNAPVYDNKALAHAWTYTSSSGDLTHYAMRVSRPEPGCEEPGYYLTHVKTHHITESKEQFRKGVSAFRHCRDESHAKSRPRLVNANERLRRLDKQASRLDTTSGPVEDEIVLPSPLAEAQREDVADGYLTSRYPGSTLAPHAPAMGGETAAHECNAWLDQHLQEDCQASFSQEAGLSQGTSFSSETITTSMTSVSTSATASRHDAASHNNSLFRPQRKRRPPKRFVLVQSQDRQ
ncbi:MAG: hypothetical protein M1817_005640 [Caeruleum heppii]|nr:MAG: hypothetical protein M1817_005640 [Caeruleum heppii]